MTNAPAALNRELLDLSGSSLRLAATQLADGLRGGVHRATKKGSGVEFAGHRPYTPGDDLRHLDRHSLLRHGRLMIREFYTDTERSVHLIVDATASMRYHSPAAKSAAAPRSKLALTALLACSLGMLARRAGDPIGLTLLTGSDTDSGKLPYTTLLPHAGSEALQRIIGLFEDELDRPASRSTTPSTEPLPAALWARALGELSSSLPSGTTFLAFSDFFDFHEATSQPLTDLTTRRRSLTAVQVLDPAEVTFPFSGAMRFVDEESGLEVETDAGSSRASYLEALARLSQGLQDELSGRVARLLRVTTDAAPLASLQRILEPR